MNSIDKTLIIEMVVVSSVVIGMIVTFFVLILLAANFVSEYSCNKFQESTGMETKWVFFNDCYVNNNGKFEPLGIFEDAQIAREGLKSIGEK